MQTDKLVDEIIDLGNLEKKFESFGWHVDRIDGHDFSKIEKSFKDSKLVNDKPVIIIADTIKGKGVSFMEHPSWHCKVPTEEEYETAMKELGV